MTPFFNELDRVSRLFPAPPRGVFAYGAVVHEELQVRQILTIMRTEREAALRALPLLPQPRPRGVFS